MKKKRITSIPALLLGCTLATAADATTYNLYYLGGQSNMDGFGHIEELPTEVAGPVKGVMIFHGNTSPDDAAVDGRGLWAELRPGHGSGYSSDGKTANYSDRFGLELSFARTLRQLEPDANIAIIKYSRGGSSIDCGAADRFGCWDPNYPDDRSTGINQYDHFLATIRHALAIDDINGDGRPDTLVPKGIIWMQGESDAAHGEEIARRYEANLERLMDLVRAALRSDDIPVVIGWISDSGQDDEQKDGKVWNHGEIVRQAQKSYVTNDPRAALVTSTDAYGYSDPWHYDSAGYLDLGIRFATAVHELQEADRPSAEEDMIQE
jgi:hypothetical protein